MINKSMTPNELLADKSFALIRTDDDGNFRWCVETYRMEGDALSDLETRLKYLVGSGSYEIVYIDHDGTVDGDGETDAIDADTLENLADLAERVALIDTTVEELKRVTDQLDRLTTAMRTVCKYIEVTCENIVTARKVDKEYGVDATDLRIRELDHARYSTMTAIASIIENATGYEFTAYTHDFPTL